jgi:hypothetical protein
MSKGFIRITLLLLASVPAILSAQESNYLGRVVAAYERGYYQEVVVNVQEALVDTSAFNPSDLLYLRTYLAFSLVALNQDDAAVAVFKQMLLVKPKMDLNPEFVSPKIINVFKRAQLEMAQTSGQAGWQQGMLFEKGRPGKTSCLWRSSLWPGWGQTYRGEMKKGKFLKWSSLGIAGALGGLWLGTYLSHQSYLDATEPSVIEARYNNYNRWYRTRNFGINLAVSFWIYSALDIMLTD